MNFGRSTRKRFDHSDSWGAASFLDITTEGSVDLLTAPSAAFADFALIAGAFAFAQVIKTFSDFYGFDKPGADEELEGTLKTHFPKEKHAGTSTSSGEGQSS